MRAPSSAPAQDASTKAVRKTNRLMFWCCACQGIVLACIAVPVLMQYLRLSPGQPFALMTTHNGTRAPANVHSRYRASEYKTSKQFFQWWNFLVYDSETHNHWTIVYSIERPPEGSRLPPAASVAMIHYEGSKRIDSVVEKFPLRLLDVSGDFNLRYLNEREGKVPHTLTAVSDDEYKLTAEFPSRGIAWELTLHRVDGFYGSQDAEQGNIDGVCTMLSTLFSYNSEVEGTITEGGKTYIVKRMPRFRSYAAGSWGCSMPRAGANSDPIDYPWSWFWLVIPDEDVQKDIAMVFGTGRFDFGFPMGSVDGGYGAVAVGGLDISGRYARLFHNTSYELPMQSSASDKMLVNLDVQRSEWSTFTDHLGSARIPLRQTFIMETHQYHISVDFHSKVEQYFRMPASLVNEDGTTTIFSDFRACGVRTHVQVYRRDPARLAPNAASDEATVAEPVPIYDDWTEAMNAVEYAYAAPLDEELLEKFYQEEQLTYR